MLKVTIMLEPVNDEQVGVIRSAVSKLEEQLGLSACVIEQLCAGEDEPPAPRAGGACRNTESGDHFWRRAPGEPWRCAFCPKTAAGS